MDRRERFGAQDPVVGMVHLDPLPGAPRFAGDREAVRARALADARALVGGGCDAVLVENFGDAPYHPETVPRHVVAELAATVRELTIALDVPLGVNVLRNDSRAAVAVAAAAGGGFVRVNVHTGSRVTDQGTLDGRAHETLRLRERVAADVAVLADVGVKHSAPAAERDLRAVARETLDRGLADGLVVSGPATGETVSESALDRVLAGRDDATREGPVFVGSGVTAETAPTLLERADGLVVGTAFKRDGETHNPVAEGRVQELVATLDRG